MCCVPCGGNEGGAFSLGKGVVYDCIGAPTGAAVGASTDDFEGACCFSVGFEDPFRSFDSTEVDSGWLSSAFDKS